MHSPAGWFPCFPIVSVVRSKTKRSLQCKSQRVVHNVACGESARTRHTHSNCNVHTGIHFCLTEQSSFGSFPGRSFCPADVLLFIYTLVCCQRVASIAPLSKVRQAIWWVDARTKLPSKEDGVIGVERKLYFAPRTKTNAWALVRIVEFYSARNRFYGRSNITGTHRHTLPTRSRSVHSV